jgi:hypothetical protein
MQFCEHKANFIINQLMLVCNIVCMGSREIVDLRYATGNCIYRFHVNAFECLCQCNEKELATM